MNDSHYFKLLSNYIQNRATSTALYSWSLLTDPDRLSRSPNMEIIVTSTGVKMPRLSEAESYNRNKFIIDRIKMGLSRVSIEKQFSEYFHVKETVTRLAFQTANDSLVILDPGNRDRTRAAMLEIIHAQLVGVQHDIAKVSQQIEAVEADRSRRSTIENQILNSIDTLEIARLTRALKLVPVHRPKYLLSCLDQRSRFRSLVVKFVTEIARLNGLYVEELPILRAIQVMANSELIPADTAKSLSTLLENLETGIDRTGSKALAAVTDMN